MNSVSSLPTWLQWLQALGTPAIAVVGALIALQQMRIASTQARIALARAQHDIFERRYAIYEAAREFLARVLTHDYVSQDTLRDFDVGTNAAQFLFPAEVPEYLSQLRQRVVGRGASQKMLQAARSTGADRADLAEKELHQTNWLAEQLQLLGGKFAPYLCVTQVNR